MTSPESPYEREARQAANVREKDGFSEVMRFLLGGVAVAMWIFISFMVAMWLSGGLGDG